MDQLMQSRPCAKSGNCSGCLRLPSCSGVSVSAEGERATKSFFLEGRWFGGIFQILLILSENAFRGWADGEALTKARRHGGVRYVNHEFFE